MTSLLNGLAFSALLMLLASGLALVYGLRGVMNFAHGALYMLGAYLAYAVSQAAGFWAALLIVPLLMAVVGAVAEIGGLRHLARRDLLDVALVTLGAAFVIQAVVVSVWGPQDRTVELPSALQGSTQVLGATYPVYRLFLIGVAVATMGVLWWWLERTRSGLLVRASSRDRETTAMMGVSVDRLGVLVVALSASLAGLAGTLASGYLAVNPGMGVQILVPSLIVIVIGGLGSISGAALAALLLGGLETFGAALLGTSVTIFLPYLALILVLTVRPQGLLGTRTV